MDYRKTTGWIAVTLMVTVACCSSLRSNNEIREPDLFKEQLSRDVNVDQTSGVTEIDCYDQSRNCFHYGKKGCSKKNMYTGTQSYTLYGNKCEKWSSRYNLPENYCRNPNGEDGPWCYTVNAVRVFDYCFIDCAADQCFDIKRGCFHYKKERCMKRYMYNGTRSYTFDGIKCKDWSSTIPSYSFLSNNYCRNPFGEPLGPFCYTPKLIRGWDRDSCFADCSVDDCYDSKRKCFHYGKSGCRKGYLYNGTRSYTFDGIKCQEWSTKGDKYSYLPKNYCRNPEGADERGPWCFGTKSIGKDDWDYCLTDCAAEDCFMYNGHRRCFFREKKCQKRYVYNGSRNFNLHNHKCAKWSSTTDYKYLPGSFCRNPGEGKAPWCYTEGQNGKWNYCFEEECHIGPCYNSSRKCFHYEKRECKTIDSYSGTRSYTLGGQKCAEWNISRAITDVEKKQLIGNLCRNPRQREGPWCYTEDGLSDYCFASCNNDNCYDSSRDCFHYRKAGCSNAYAYIGTQDYSVNRWICQSWRVYYLAMHTAGNLCRNPKGSKKGPWCLISPHRPDWDYCFEDCDADKCYNSEKDCFDGEKQECRVSYAYLGDKDHTASGKKCQPWSTAAEIGPKSYCRMIHGEVIRQNAPWCYTGVRETRKKAFCFFDCVQKNLVLDYTCGLYPKRSECEDKAGVACVTFGAHRYKGKCDLLKSKWFHCICERVFGG